MVSGFDRYFQIARCFRDEDLRANRQPEFTQLDVEMSFVEDQDVMSTHGASRRRHGPGVQRRRSSHFRCPRLEYHDVMERFGSDRPDLRYGLELKDVADIADQTEFKVFKQAREFGHRIRGLCAPGVPSAYSRKDLDGLTEYRRHVRRQGSGLAQGRGRRPLPVRPPSSSRQHAQAKLRERFDAQAGDLILIVADTQAVTSQALSNLRARLAAELEALRSRSHSITPGSSTSRSWPGTPRKAVTSPSITRSRCRCSRTCPCSTPIPAKVRAQAYDLVINGEEAGGGTIRCHDPAIQSKIFALLGLTPEEAEEKFGFLLERPAQRCPAAWRHRAGASTGWSCSTRA